ncbi:MAG: PepSY domain-containing protein [Planctomycetota bacterium]|jgi:hypothetical protein
MKPRKTTYLVHRWVALVVSLQLLAWSVGGLVFSILEIDAVRGDADANLAALALGELDAASTGSAIARVLGEIDRSRVADVSIVDRGAGAAIEVTAIDGTLVGRFDVGTGAALPRLTAAEASALAVRDFVPGAEAVRVDLLESDPPGEYRGKPLPAYRVELAHRKRPNIYIDAVSGQVHARRNRSWRVFDFLWMLHIMDYKDRDDFNHPLLTSFSVLAVVTSLTGMALWGWRMAPRRRSASADAVM